MHAAWNERIIAFNLSSLLTSITVIIKIWHALYATDVHVPVVSENVFSLDGYISSSPPLVLCRISTHCSLSEFLARFDSTRLLRLRTQKSLIFIFLVDAEVETATNDSDIDSPLSPDTGSASTTQSFDFNTTASSDTSSQHGSSSIEKFFVDEKYLILGEKLGKRIVACPNVSE